MFGATVFLAGRAEFVSRPPRFVDPSDFERSGESFRAIMSGLDSLGLGDWEWAHTGGGCYVFQLTFGDGCYLMVGDSCGPLSSSGDADDFGSGGVMVGFYGPDGSGCYEGVTVVSPFTDDGDAEYAIVVTVGEILTATGVSDQGVSWSALATFVAGAECQSCDGSGWHAIGTTHRWSCSSCVAIGRASEWIFERDEIVASIREEGATVPDGWWLS